MTADYWSVRVFPKKSANQLNEMALTICNSISGYCLRLMRGRSRPETGITMLRKRGLLTIRPNIPVFRSDEWNSIFRLFVLTRPRPSCPNFARKYKWNQTEDSLPFWLLLLSVGLLDDSEVEINNVLGEDGNINLSRLNQGYDTFLFSGDKLKRVTSNDEESCLLARSSPQFT